MPNLLKVITDPKLLRDVASPVPEITPEIRQLIRDMEHTMKEAGGIGLAAPQVGVPLRIIVVHANGSPGGLVRAFVNPVILERNGSQTFDEGCLSLPEDYGPVTRSSFIRIQSLGRMGPNHYTTTGLEATCIQHEIDHLNGILFIDHLWGALKSRE